MLIGLPMQPSIVASFALRRTFIIISVKLCFASSLRSQGCCLYALLRLSVCCSRNNAPTRSRLLCNSFMSWFRLIATCSFAQLFVSGTLVRRKTLLYLHLSWCYITFREESISLDHRSNLSSILHFNLLHLSGALRLCAPPSYWNFIPSRFIRAASFRLATTIRTCHCHDDSIGDLVTRFGRASSAHLSWPCFHLKQKLDIMLSMYPTRLIIAYASLPML